MPMKSNSKTLVTFVILAAALSIPTGSGAVQDQPENKIPSYTAGIADYNFLIASGFLCDADHFRDCPAVAQTANGESIEIDGAGTLNVANKSVVGAGAFTERTRMGEVVTTGTWVATGLMNFQSYGLAPGALQLDYPKLRAFRPPFMSLGKVPDPMSAAMAGPVAVGGLAVIGIRLLPDVGNPAEAVLQVRCGRGKVPEGQGDGIRVTITGGAVFDQQVSGTAVFLLRRSGTLRVTTP